MTLFNYRRVRRLLRAFEGAALRFEAALRVGRFANGDLRFVTGDAVFIGETGFMIRRFELTRFTCRRRATGRAPPDCCCCVAFSPLINCAKLS